MIASTVGSSDFAPRSTSMPVMSGIWISETSKSTVAALERSRRPCARSPRAARRSLPASARSPAARASIARRRRRGCGPWRRQRRALVRRFGGHNERSALLDCRRPEAGPGAEGRSRMLAVYRCLLTVRGRRQRDACAMCRCAVRPAPRHANLGELHVAALMRPLRLPLRQRQTDAHRRCRGPRADSTWISPSWSLTMRWTIASPSPVPRSNVPWNGWKMPSRSSAGMPTPSSLDRSTRSPLTGCRRAAPAKRRATAAPPLGMARSPLVARFQTICRSWCSSASNQHFVGRHRHLDACGRRAPRSCCAAASPSRESTFRPRTWSSAGAAAVRRRGRS